MKRIKASTTLLLLGLFIVVWINLPENKYIPAPRIDTTVLSRHIEKEFTTKLGLDLKGGSQLVFEADLSKIKDSDRESALESTRDIIERRVNFFGVSESSVQTVSGQNSERIVIELPGLDNTRDAINLLGTTAKLSFMSQDKKKIATDSVQLESLTVDTGLSGKHIKKAQTTFDSTGQPAVEISFTNEGAKLFENVTEKNVGKPVGIFIDSQLLSAPVVQQKITGGTAIITGSFTPEGARQLSIAINSGALPVPIKLIEQRTIGPTLGAEQVNQSIFAGSLGLLSVILFMMIYYGRLGIIAGLGLTFYALTTFAIFRTVPVTLTLPGVAGFILSIGMAVDANILIFERIKEERRAGRDHEVAVTLGFGRAIDAIKDANVTTLIVAFVLFNPLNWTFLPQFSLVKGFALTLAIGVAVSLFTGVFITRRLINTFYKTS